MLPGIALGGAIDIGGVVAVGMEPGVTVSVALALGTPDGAGLVEKRDGIDADACAEVVVSVGGFAGEDVFVEQVAICAAVGVAVTT